MSRRLAVLAALAAAVLPAAAPAQALRCEKGLVSPGQTTLDLLAKCGAPALREPLGPVYQERTVSDGRGTVTGRRLRAAAERWTYNRGALAFLQHVVVEGGVVRSVESGRRGLDPAAVSPVVFQRGRCNPQLDLVVGMSSFEVVGKCGEPAVRDVRYVETMVSTRLPGTELVTETWVAGEAVESWVYDFGPQAFTRRLELVNGVLVRVKSGGYGYAPEPE